MVGWFFFVKFSLNLLAVLGMNHAAGYLLGVAGGVVLLALALYVVWRHPDRDGTVPADRASRAVPWLLTLYLVGVWLLLFTGSATPFFVGVVLLLLPIAIRCAEDGVANLLRPAGIAAKLEEARRHFESVCKGNGRAPEVDWDAVVRDLASFGERLAPRIPHDFVLINFFSGNDFIDNIHPFDWNKLLSELSAREDASAFFTSVQRALNYRASLDVLAWTPVRCYTAWAFLTAAEAVLKQRVASLSVRRVRKRMNSMAPSSEERQLPRGIPFDRAAVGSS